MGDRRRAAWAVLGCLVSFAGLWAAQWAAHVSIVDVMVYRAAGWSVRTGGDLYGMRFGASHLPMTYPPFAGLLFVPLTLIGPGLMRTATVAANLLLAVAVAALSLRLAGRPQRLVLVLPVAALSVWTEPVWATIRYGQVNLLLAVLVLWDLTRRTDNRWAGVGIGIAAGIKLTPALFVVYLAAAALTAAGRGAACLRRALVAAGTFAASVALAAAALPYDSRRYWTDVVFATDRPGYGENVANQSLRGIAARLEHTGDPGALWLAAALAAGLLGVLIAVGAVAAGDRLPSGRAWAGAVCGITALLVSPVSWTHHWVWIVPMLVLLGSEAVRRRDRAWAAATAALTAVFSAYEVWYVPHGPGRYELHENAGEMVLAAAYPAAGAAFLALAGAVVARALRGGRARPPATAGGPPVREPARTP